jgi:uncharacterized glyoxalase superfamily protein PhnB
MTSADLTDSATQYLHCGCCGRTMPADRLAELGSTPGIYLCTGCGLWVARRASRLSDLHWLTHTLSRVARWRPGRRHRHDGGLVNSAIPILTSTNLDRTSLYWRAFGFDVVERHDGYLVTHAQGVEIHFSHNPDADPRPTTADDRDAPLVFIHAHDAAAFWKRLMGEGVSGVGPIQDMDHGLREFVITDPDGNRVRIGSPIHC